MFQHQAVCSSKAACVHESPPKAPNDNNSESRLIIHTVDTISQNMSEREDKDVATT
jgi:hypothetical protein